MTNLEEMAQFLHDDKITGKLILATQEKGKNNLVFYKVKPRKKVVQAYRKAYLNRVKARLGLQIIGEESTDDTMAHEILRYGVNEVPDANDVLNPSTRESGFNQKIIRSIKYTAFHFTNKAGKKLIIFRRYKRNPLLTQKKLDLFTLSKDIIDFARKDMLHLDRRADCVVYSNEILVFWRSGFERIFNYTKVYKEQAKGVFTYFKTNAPFKTKNIDRFERSCTDLEALRKMSNIFRTGYYKTQTIRKLKQLSDNDVTLGMTVDLSNNSVEFESFEKFQHFWRDDDLISEFTGKKYTAILKKLR